MTRRHNAAVVAVALLLSAAPASAADPAENFSEPTSQQLDASVTVYTTADSITVYDLAGSVGAVESRTTEGAEEVLRLASDILFAFGSAQLSPEGTTRIGELVADLPQGVAVSVTGRTDSIGTGAANLELSRQRAQAVAAAVTAARGDLQLMVDGRGASDPVAPNTSGGKDDAEGRRQNRRVEIRYAG
jgi:outer membrane protein OmpA-like peptidoglycan-associated protein